MFCTNCGNEVAEKAIACTKCGMPPRSEKKFCYSCGAEVTLKQVMCVKCGVGLSDSSTSQGKTTSFSSYDQVPWYRKNWFAIVCFFIFTPGLLIVLLTGDIYYESKGQLKTYSKGAKIFIIVWSILYIFAALSQGINSPEVKMVKKGSLSSCPNVTLEKMVDGFMGSPSWESGKSDDGKTFVNVSGNIKLHEKKVKAVIQFLVNKDQGSFEFNAFEINEVPQNNFMAMGLLKKMCESATP